MDLKDLDRIHKEQAERTKLSYVLHRFDEWANLRNALVCIGVVVVLIGIVYGFREMNFLFEASPVEQITEPQPVPEETVE